MVGMQGSMDFRGSDFTASLTAANTDIVNSSGNYLDYEPYLIKFIAIFNKIN